MEKLSREEVIHTTLLGLLHAAVLCLTERNGVELRTYFGCPIGEESDLKPTAYVLSDDVETRRLWGLPLPASVDCPRWRGSIPVIFR